MFLPFLDRLLLLVLASIIIFGVMSILPGDPASLMLGLDASPESIMALHRQLGLAGSPITRYLHWIWELCHGQAGNSYTYGVPVFTLVNERLASSLPLIFMATILSLALGLPAGTAAAARQGQRPDFMIMGVLQLVKSIPDFWLAILLTFVFSLTLHWLPASGFPGWHKGMVAGLRALVLPAVALALPQAAITARFMRSAMIDTLSQEFIQTARAQGYSRLSVIWRIAVPNSLISVIVLVGIQLPMLVTGTIIVENVFDIPGCGRLLLEAVNQRDVAIVQNLVMLIVAAVLILNAVIGVAVHWLDPRLTGTRS